MKKTLAIILAILMIVTTVPMAFATSDVVASGECGVNGDNLTWSLDSDGVLTISGTGVMADYDNVFWPQAGSYLPPWNDYKEDIKKIVIEEGVTELGSWAFFECTALTEISFPDSLTSTEVRTFHGCSSLTEVVIPEGLQIDGTDFQDCSSLKRVVFLGRANLDDYYHFDGCVELEEIVFAKGGTNTVDMPFSIKYINSDETIIHFGGTEAEAQQMFSPVSQWDKFYSVAKIHYLNDCVCSDCGTYHIFENNTCNVCGLVCNFGEDYETDEKYHWLECTDDACDVKSKKYHVFDNGVCSICEYECLHSYNNGKCTLCCFECPHESFVECKCVVCGIDCSHKNVVDDKCEACGAEGKFITITMSDSYGDGWNGNAIVIEKLIDGVYTEVASATFENGDTATYNALLDKDGVYVFKWIQGSYPNECSFVINVGGEDVYEVTGASGLTNGQELYRICAHKTFTDGKCDDCGSPCPHTSFSDAKCDGCGTSAVVSVKVGENIVYKMTLEEAIEVAQAAENSILTLLDDHYTETSFEINSGKFTLDLNGKTISADECSPLEIMGGDITICDSGIGGTIECRTTGYAVYNMASLTVESGIFKSPFAGISSDGESFIINGGTFEGTYSVYGAGGPVELNGGTFNGIVWAFCPVTINGGTYTSDYIGINSLNDVFVVNGGEFDINKIEIYKGEVSLQGGTFINGFILNDDSADMDDTNTQTVMDLLAEGCNYYDEDGNIVSVADDETEIDVTVTVSAHICNFSGEWKYDSEKHWKECTCGEIDGEAEHTFTDGKCDCGYECPHESTYRDLIRPVQNADGTWGKGKIVEICNICGNSSFVQEVERDHEGYKVFDETAAELEAILNSGKMTDKWKNDYTNRLNGLRNSAYYQVYTEIETAIPSMTESLKSIIAEIEAGIADGTMIKADFTYMTSLFDEINALIDNDPNKLIPSESGRFQGIYYGYYMSCKNNGNHSQFDYDQNMAGNNWEGQIEDILAGVKDGTMLKADYTAIDEAIAEIEEKLGDVELTDEAKAGLEEIKAELEEMKADGNTSAADLAELEKALDEYETELDAGIEDGSALKADYTAIDEAIAEIEEKLGDVELTDEAKAGLEEIKAELEEMKADGNTSAADLAELEKAIEDYETELDAGIEDGSAVKVDGFAIIREHSIHRITELNEKYGRAAYNDVVNAAADIINKESDAIEAEANALTGSVKENEEKIAELISRLDASFLMIENCLMGVHNGLEFKVTEEAKCEKDAIESADCAFCGATVSRVAGGTALRHSFTKYETVEEAKCGVAGKEQAYCDNGCGEIEVRATEALKHIPLDAVKENEVDPECEKEGSYDLVVYCDLCGGEISRETVAVDALEHIFVDYVYNNDATCTADGTKTANCLYNCGKTDTVTAEDTMLDHADEDGDKICDDCETEIKDVCPDCGGPAHEETGVPQYICMLITLIKLVVALVQALQSLQTVA